MIITLPRIIAERKLNRELPVYKLCRPAVGFDDPRRQGQFDLIAAGKRTKRIVVQLTQARPLDHNLSGCGWFGGDCHFTCAVFVLLVFVRARTQPLESVAQLEMIEIPLNRIRIQLHDYLAANLTRISASSLQQLIHVNSGLPFQLHRLAITHNQRQVFSRSIKTVD